MFKSRSRSKSLKGLRASRGDNGAAAADQDVVAPARHGPSTLILGHMQEQTGLVHVSDVPQTPTKQTLPQNLNTGGSPSSSHLSSSFTVNDGSNAYVSRPLPQPPSRPHTRSPSRQTTAERPSTSAGPATGSSRMPAFADGNSNTRRPNTAYKRGSRDDFYINTQSTKSFRSYHIPIRGKPPSPSGSLRSAQFPDATIAVRTQTPDSMIANNPAAPIGMAIGSPNFPPPAQAAPPIGSWQPQLRGIENRPPWEEPPEPAPARKPSKWRLFGRLGSKKSEAKERRAATPDFVATPLSEARPKTSSGVRSRDHDEMWRSNTIAGRKAKNITPLIIRSQTESAVEAPTSGYPKEPKTPKTPKTPKAQKAPALVRRSSTKSLREGIRKADISPPMPIEAPPMPPMPMLGKGGFLDIDIPNVKLDRYSVMFDGILHPQGQGQAQDQGPSNPRNSVFARRQAVKKLQTIEDAIKEEEVRARGESVSSRTGPTPLTLARETTATTVSTATAGTADTRTVTVSVPASDTSTLHKTHTKSPSFSLFPAPPTASSARGRMTPVGNSSSATADPYSPSMANFDLSEPFLPPPRLRSDTSESQTPSQMSQHSRDIPIAIDGDLNRGRPSIPHVGASQIADDAARLEQRVYARDRSRSSSRSTQRSEQARQARETSQSRQVPVSQFSRVAKPAPLNISRVPRPTAQAERPQAQDQVRNRSRSGSRTRIPQPVRASHESQPQPQQSSFRQDQSAHLVDSPTDTTRDQMTISQRTMPPEPVWQIMSPPTSSISSTSTSASSRKRSPSSASSTYTATSSYAPPTGTIQATKPSADKPDMNINRAVEVSIARQISISRQQRNLLQHPARSRPWMRADATPVGVGSTTRARQMEMENERVRGPRMAKPMYISSEAPTAYRNSERVVIEGL